MSEEERSFVYAVIESPDDDLPRLVFADWLDEHGEVDRAAFIRLSVEILATVRWGEPHHKDFAGVHRLREQRGEVNRILTSQGFSSLDGLPRWPFPRDQIEPIWERGFVRGVICSGGMWLEYGDDVMRDNPIRDVTLTGRVDAERLRKEIRALPQWTSGHTENLLRYASTADLLGWRWPRVKGWDLSMLRARPYSDIAEWPMMTAEHRRLIPTT